MKKLTKTFEYGEMAQLLQPKTDLEIAMMQSLEWQKGVAWGKPRNGHPEGQVLYHIKEVLDNVDKLSVDEQTYRQLRLITLIHDTFKYKETRGFPRDWSKHHAVFARQFAEQFLKDQAVLDVIELHDEAYYCWKMEQYFMPFRKTKQRFETLLERIGDNIQLYYLFFKCDTQTGNKTQKPVIWFESQNIDIKIVNF